MTEERSDIEKVETYYSGDYSEKDLSIIASLFCDSTREEDLKHILRVQWYELFKQEIKEEKNFDHVLHRIHYEINTRDEKNRKKDTILRIARWFSRVAAILIIPLAIYSGIQFFGTTIKDDLAWVEVKAPAWTRAQFSLPDGTTGWLNSNSSIRYSGNFNNNRQLWLNGEAFFDVIKDVRKPFKVETDEIIFTVLGTRFNIASYDNENVVEIVLEEGEVVCYNKELTKSCALKPNDYLSFDKKQKIFKIETVQAEKYSSWKEGKLIFRNDPIEVIARRLERWYNIEVEVRDKLTNHNGLWATFIDENLEEVLRLLQLSLPIKYKIENPQMQPDGVYSKTKVIITRT